MDPYFDQPFYVGFRVGGFELGLDPDLGDGAPGPGGSTAYWGVEDIGLGLRTAWSRSAPRPVSPPKEVGDGIKSSATVADPLWQSSSA